jgi:hypothetical protein
MDGIQEMLTKAQAYDKLIADGVLTKAETYDQMVDMGLDDMIKKAEACEEFQKKYDELLKEKEHKEVVWAEEVPVVSPEELSSPQEDEGSWSKVVKKKYVAKKHPVAKAEGVDLERPISKEIMKSSLHRYCMAKVNRTGPNGHSLRCMDVAQQLGWTLPSYETSPLPHTPDYDHSSVNEVPPNIAIWSPKQGRWVEKYSPVSPIYKTGVCLKFFGEGCCFTADECVNCHRESELRPYVRYMG